MSIYNRVYAPNGEPFDVVRDIADHLVLDLGWTQTPLEDLPVGPVDAPAPAPKSKSKITEE